MAGWDAAYALSLMQQGRLHEAAARISARVHAEAGDGEAWFLLGSVAQQRGDHDAPHHFERAIDLLPDDIRPLAALGAMRGDAGDAAAALALFERALAIEPDNPRLLTNAGVALENLGRVHEALARYERALSVFSGFGDARRNRCVLRLALGDATSARDDARQLIASFPDLALAHKLLGDCEAACGNLGSARTAYRRATSLDPADVDSWRRLGAVARELGDAATVADAAARGADSAAVD